MSYLRRIAPRVMFVLGAAAATTGPLQGQSQLDLDPAVFWLAAAETDENPAPHVDFLAESFGRTLAASSDPNGADWRLETGADAEIPPIAPRSIMLRPSVEPNLRRPVETLPMFERRQDRRGVPWIIAGSALIVGGALVGDDVGTVLMVGGVGVTAYGLYIYF